jgi:hypothetical protein
MLRLVQQVSEGAWSTAMAVNAEMTLASTRQSPVGQRKLLSQQKVRGATRTGAFGNEGWIGVMMCKCAPGLAVEWLNGRDTSPLTRNHRDEMRWRTKTASRKQLPHLLTRHE